MGNAKIYYYPDRSSGLETVDLGLGLERLGDENVSNGQVTRGIGGQVYPTSLGRYTEILAQANGITGEDTYMALRTFETFCERGMPYGISADADKTWAAFTDQPLSRGDTVIQLKQASAFSGSYESSGTVTAGDYVVLSSGYPEQQFEMAKVSSLSGRTLTLDSGLVHRFTQLPILIRWCRFFPALVRTASGPIVRDTVPGVVWRLDLQGETVALENPTAEDVVVRFPGERPDLGEGKANLFDVVDKQTGGTGDASSGSGTTTMQRPGRLSGVKTDFGFGFFGER